MRFPHLTMTRLVRRRRPLRQQQQPGPAPRLAPTIPARRADQKQPVPPAAPADALRRRLVPVQPLLVALSDPCRQGSLTQVLLSRILDGLSAPSCPVVRWTSGDERERVRRVRAPTGMKTTAT